jgi:type I restriction enzyme S subunit
MGSRWVSGEFAYVSTEKAQTLQANLARPGDIVFTQRGTLGQVALVPDGGFSSYVISQSQMKLTVDRSKADPLCLFYVFSSPGQQEYIRQNAIQVGVPHTNLGILRDTPVSLPPLSNQLAIAHILGTLDDKIELNRRMNETLEAMARAIFKSWFVDFDPVRAKASSEPPESICRRLGLTPDVLALFPNSFQDSELGEIPAGWAVRSLDSVADFLNGLALQKYPATGDDWLPVIKIAQLRSGDTRSAGRASTEIPPAYVIRNGDVLFSWSGSLEVEIWCGGEGALNQHLFKVTSADFPKWFYFLWTRHHLQEFRDIAANKATTMGHIQRKHLTDAKVLCPDEKVLAAMGTAMDPLISKMVNCRLESNELGVMRDTLLPKLLSGELSIPQMEAAA